MTPVDTEERFNDGTILLPQSVRDGFSQYQCEVLGVGLPSICEDKKCDRPHRHSLMTDPNDWMLGRPSEWLLLHGLRETDGYWTHPTDGALVVGAWILVRPRSYVDTGHPTKNIYLVHQRDVEACFSVTEASAEVPKT